MLNPSRHERNSKETASRCRYCVASACSAKSESTHYLGQGRRMDKGQATTISDPGNRDVSWCSSVHNQESWETYDQQSYLNPFLSSNCKRKWVQIQQEPSTSPQFTFDSSKSSVSCYLFFFSLGRQNLLTKKSEMLIINQLRACATVTAVHNNNLTPMRF